MASNYSFKPTQLRYTNGGTEERATVCPATPRGLTQVLGAMVRPPKPPDLKAEIAYLATKDGGKSNPVRSGYRPSHDFGLEAMLNDAHHEYVDVELVQPGTTAKAELWLLAPEYQVGRLFPGFKFTVQEGARVVAHGVVTEVFNPALRHGT